jgi:SAM-dependent methyltransferase
MAQIAQCYLCGSRALEPLRLPGGHSVTTDGQALDVPLEKYQCLDCTLVQSDPSPVLNAGVFAYESSYDFYARPLMRDFERVRYQKYADWVASFLERYRPKRVLEVGCGAGWVLELLRGSHPTLSFQGLEPSKAATQSAAAAGLEVHRGSLDDHPFSSGSFDFVYCINVLEHVPDPTSFMRRIGELLAPEGTALIICPCANVIDPELLFADHLYSYSKENLRRLAAAGGLAQTAWQQGTGMQYAFQAMCCSKGPADISAPADGRTSSWWPDAALPSGRRDYFRRWAALEETLLARLSARNVVCFGAGETADLLQVHAPRCWEAVTGHMIDRPNGVSPEGKPKAIKGLPVRFVEDHTQEDFDSILLGVKPRYQEAISARLRMFGKPVVRWDDVIPEPFA